MYCRKAYNELKKELGLLDAYIELSELSHRDFIANAKEAESVEEFIKVKSSEHGIIVSSKSLDQIKKTFSRSYIALTYNAFEKFFDDFRENYNDFTGDNFEYQLNKKGGKKITRFDYLLEKFEELKLRIPQNHIDLYSYFRQVRIKMTHQNYDKGKVNKAYSQIKLDQKKYFDKKGKKEFSVKEMPNNYDNLNFDDWLMFTKLIKSIAHEISKLAIPTSEMLVKNYKLKRLNKYDDEDKKKEAIKKVLWSDFVIEKEFAIFMEVNDLISS